jgi:hypothetical protein
MSTRKKSKSPKRRIKSNDKFDETVLNSYKFIKEIENYYGSLQLVSKDDIPYVRHVEHILDSEIKKDKSSLIWREIAFNTNVTKKYPQYFAQLVEYKFIENCDIEMKKTSNENNRMIDLPTFNQERIKSLSKSTTCVEKIYTSTDGKLDEIIKILTKCQVFSLIIQFVNIIGILRKHKYIYGGISFTSIGFNRTNDKFIKILGINIPTFGYIYKLIDHMFVMHESDISDKNEKTKYISRINSEESLIMNLLLRSTNRKCIMDGYSYDELSTLKKLTKTYEYTVIKNITSQPLTQMLLFNMLYPTVTYKALVKTKDCIQYPSVYIPEHIFVIYATLGNDTKKIVDYFYNILYQEINGCPVPDR